MTRPALLRVCDRNNEGEEELMFLAQARACVVCSYQDLSHVNVDRNSSQQECVLVSSQYQCYDGQVELQQF
jgi:hypothetical protein